MIAQTATSHAPSPVLPPTIPPPSAYRTPPSIQIELEVEQDTSSATQLSAREPDRPSFTAVPPTRTATDFGVFDLAQRIELTGVIDFEEATAVEARRVEAPLASSSMKTKEKGACTKACANCKKAARIAATAV
ncbi:hypothetical protein JCM10908_006500 [Rhodotorula pacifica]|uniref:uncharacterized protein n=1 Tax=Rhodotorula pacifica TaxID=1495444 RepID=UPI00316CCC9D